MKLFLTLVFNNNYFSKVLAKLEEDKGPLLGSVYSSNMFVFWLLIIALNLTQNK